MTVDGSARGEIVLAVVVVVVVVVSMHLRQNSCLTERGVNKHGEIRFHERRE